MGWSTVQMLLVSLLVLLSCMRVLGDRWRDICPQSECESVSLREQRKHLDTGVVYSGGVKVYCIRPIDINSLPALCHAWHRNVITVTSNNYADLTLLVGNSSYSIHQQSSVGGSWWSSTSRSGSALKDDLSDSFSPYDTTCVGVRGDDVTFTITFEKKFVYYYPILLLVGLFLFFLAPGFSRNATFYYASGISIGIVASLLVLLYVFSKFVPKKNLLGLGVLFSGYGAAILVCKWLWSNGVEIMLNNFAYILLYIVVSGVASFAFLYWRGPASVRTLSLLQWGLQLIGLLLVWGSTQLQTLSIALLCVVIVFYYTRSKLLRVFNYCCFCLRPILKLFRHYPKRKLLTIEEYEHQAVVETDTALNELRQYCRRNPSLYNKVNSNQEGLLKFMAGKDHVSVHERDQHEAEYSWFYDSSDEEDSIPSPEVSFIGSSSSPPSPSPTKRYHWK